MASYNKPLYYFSGIVFDSAYYGNVDTSIGLTEQTANGLYLRKNVPDTDSSIAYFTGILGVGNLQTLSTTASIDIACNNTIGAINVGLLTSSNINIGNTGNTTNISSSNLIFNSIKLRYLDWRTFTMSIKGSGGTGTLVSIVGNVVSSTFCVAGNMLMIKHYYVGPTTSSTIGTGVYGFTVPTDTDTGFPFTANSLFVQTDLLSGSPTGTTFGRGSFIQTGTTTGTISTIGYKILSGIPYLFTFCISGSGGSWQSNLATPYGLNTITCTWEASIPIIIT